MHNAEPRARSQHCCKASVIHFNSSLRIQNHFFTFALRNTIRVMIVYNENFHIFFSINLCTIVMETALRCAACPDLLLKIAL